MVQEEDHVQVKLLALMVGPFQTENSLLLKAWQGVWWNSQREHMNYTVDLCYHQEPDRIRTCVRQDDQMHCLELCFPSLLHSPMLCCQTTS